MSVHAAGLIISLQWGPVVVTGIRGEIWDYMGAKYGASMGSGRGDRNQIHTVVGAWGTTPGFNGVRSW